MRIVSAARWYTYVGPTTNGLRRGQVVHVDTVGFGSWAGKVKVRGAARPVSAEALRGPGTSTAVAARPLVKVVR